MAEKLELVLLRKRRKALNRAIAALEELVRLPGREIQTETSRILVPFPRVKGNKQSQRIKP
jgi:hypothetical protein